MKKNQSLTEGKIFPTLIRFALPVLFAIFLQSLYGAVDLLVVGQFATTADVSGVSTGSQLMHTVTCLIAGLSMGLTVIVGNRIGEGKPKEAGKAIGTGIALFAVVSVVLTVIFLLLTSVIAKALNAPEEAFGNTVSYLRICFSGLVFITAYNILGSIFRGIGDSVTPLVTVAISCVLNVACDILFVAVFHMGASGAAFATVLSQTVSVITSFVLIRRKSLPIEFSIKDIRFDMPLMWSELKIGIPIALSDLLVGFSFLVIQAVVNSISLVASAAIGVGEKVCAFIMLVPSAFSQAITAFVAQNLGAGKPERASKALLYGILTSECIGLLMFYLAFFHGDFLALLFAKDIGVIEAAHSYLKAYAIDCMLTPFLFCMLGYFNGYGKTSYVMFQGIFSAFCIRTPLAILFSRLENTSLFLIGLSTPCASIIQIAMGLFMILHIRKQRLSSKLG